MDLSQLFCQLIRIEGLDIWKGLSHVGCNRAVYASTLKLFCGELEERTTLAREFLKKENWKGYINSVHALKGGFAGIGAWMIAQKAWELEDSAWKKDYAVCRKHTGEVFKSMGEFALALRSTVLFDLEQQIKEKTTLAYLNEKFNALHTACRSGDSILAESIAAELRAKTYDSETDELTEKICNLVESLDYEQVLKYLEKLLSGLRL